MKKKTILKNAVSKIAAGAEISDREKIENLTKENSELKTQLEICRKQAQEYLDGWRKIKAEYANLNKDTENRQLSAMDHANTKFIVNLLLPLHINFKTALKHIPEEQQNLDWVIGIKHIKNQLDNFLKGLEVKEIEAVGQFNPSYHEAINQEWRDDMEDGEIIQEVEGGYMWKDRVIKPARVIVNVK